MSKRNNEAGLPGQFVLENQSDRSRTTIGDTMSAGRDPACDLVLSSEKCSRLHAKLSVSDGALRVEDQGSTNGTAVNGKKIREMTALGDGDVVQFGDLRFRVIAPVPEPAEPDDQGTVMVGEQTMLAMDGEEQGTAQPDGSDPKPETDDAGARTASGASPDQSRGSGGDAKTTSGKTAGSGQKRKKASKKKAAEAAPRETPSRADESAPEEPESPSVEGKAAGGDPSIPRSWADADQLEQASHTAFVARPRASAPDSESGGLPPAKAIAQARRKIPAEEAVLVGLTEPIRGRPFKLSRRSDTEKWELGRGKGADIDIDDESVSGRHAQLIYERGRWKVVNMMSVNGTFVNERKVLSAYLGPRDVIRMGTVELVFDARIEKPEPAPRSEKSVGSGAPGDDNLAARLVSRLGDFWRSLARRIRGKR